MKQYIVIPVLEEKQPHFYYDKNGFLPSVSKCEVQIISHFVIGEIITHNSIKILDVKFDFYEEANKYYEVLKRKERVRLYKLNRLGNDGC